MAFHALADYQNHVIGWLQWEQRSLGDGAVVRFPRIWMSSGECRLRANPDVGIRDKSEVFKMRVREVVDDPERQRLWDAGTKAFPPYIEYQEKTSRQIPVFVAEPV